MSQGFAYIDILFFAMVAAFIALRLRGVLGKRTGHEQERRRTDTVSQGDKVVAMPARPGARPGSEGAIAEMSDGAVKSGLTQIRLADARFELEPFLAGARQAFEMIVEAFAAGDKDTLRPLLAPDVFEGFAGAIDERLDAGYKLDTQVLRMKSVEVVEAGMSDTRARIAVRFVSEQINVTRDVEGRVVDGDPDTAQDVTDVWTFERDTRATDPNWELVETRVPD